MDHELKSRLFPPFLILLTVLLTGCFGVEKVARPHRPVTNQHRLQSAKYFLKTKQLKQAQHSLDEIKTTDPKLMLYKRILTADLLLKKGAHHQALTTLNRIWQPQRLPPDYQQRFYTVRAKAYLQNGHLFEAARDAVELPDHMLTWEILSQANPKSLQRFKHQAATNKPLQGWIELAYLKQLYDPNSQHFAYAFQQWQQRFPDHPGKTMLPGALKAQFQAPTHAPQKIGLLLPDSGQYHKSGEIIRDGFLASYYELNRNRAPSHTVVIYSTGDGSEVLSAYKQALADQVDFIVGPLMKREVNAIASLKRLKVPVLALNTIYNTRYLPNNLYLFGLPPEMEVQAITQKAKQANHEYALLIVPENQWGHRMAAAFKDHWQNLGGTLLGTTFFGVSKNHARKMRKLLEISSSEDRAKKIQALLGKKIVFEPRRRADPDVIFMATSPEMARELKPLLNFYYAADLPVYATSHVFSAQNNAEKDRDLNNIIFCDMPWVLEHTPKIERARTNLSQLWPTSFDRSPRLFALGMDAYHLSYHLSRLSHFPETLTNGMTGQLALYQNHYIKRRLTFAKIKNGIPKLIP